MTSNYREGTAPQREERRGHSWLDDSVYPFASRFSEIDGNRVHYIDEGNGPVLLFLHGQPAWSFLYRNIIKDLRADFRCIAVDYPGFGLSTAVDGFSYSIVDYAKIVEQFVLTFDLSDVTLVVHDSGGSIGMGLAIRHPERFRALVTSNTFAWSLDNYPGIERFLKVVGSSLFGFFNINFNLLVRGTMMLGGGPRKFSKAEKAGYFGPFTKRSSRRAMHLLFRSLANEKDYLREVERGLEK